MAACLMQVLGRCHGCHEDSLFCSPGRHHSQICFCCVFAGVKMTLDTNSKRAYLSQQFQQKSQD